MKMEVKRTMTGETEPHQATRGKRFNPVDMIKCELGSTHVEGAVRLTKAAAKRKSSWWCSHN